MYINDIAIPKPIILKFEKLYKNKMEVIGMMSPKNMQENVECFFKKSTPFVKLNFVIVILIAM